MEIKEKCLIRGLLPVKVMDLKLNLKINSGNQILRLCESLKDVDGGLASAFEEKEINVEDVHGVLCSNS